MPRLGGIAIVAGFLVSAIYLIIAMIIEKEKIIYYQATLMLQKSEDFLLCDKIFVGSNHSKESILNHNKKLDPNSIKLIQSGIDINYFIKSITKK